MDIVSDLENGECPILLAELRDQSFIPRKRGKKPDKSVAFRWSARGVSGHRLESKVGPSGKYTTRSAYFRFCAALSGEGPIPAPTWRQREKQVASADRELEACGI